MPPHVVVHDHDQRVPILAAVGTPGVAEGADDRVLVAVGRHGRRKQPVGLTAPSRLAQRGLATSRSMSASAAPSALAAWRGGAEVGQALISRVSAGGETRPWAA